LDEVGNEKIETTSNESEEDELNDDSIVVISSCGDEANGEEGGWNYIYFGYIRWNLWLPGLSGFLSVLFKHPHFRPFISQLFFCLVKISIPNSL